MDGQQSLHRFNFNDHFAGDNYINTVAAVQPHILVENRKRHLAGKRDSSLFKFEAKTFFISRFEQPRSELLMNFNRPPDDKFAHFGSV